MVSALFTQTTDTEANVVLTYPNDSICGNLSGVIITSPLATNLGVWVGKVAPLNTWRGVL